MSALRPVSLDAALRSLAADVEFPATPDLVSGASRRFRSGTHSTRLRWRWTSPAMLAAILTLLLAASAVALAWVLPGLRITPVASLPAAPPLGTGLGLGQPAPAGDPQPFTVRGLGPAEGTYVGSGGEVVTLVFAPRESLPELGQEIGLLVQRISGTLNVEMVEKLVDEVDARVVPVSVGDAEGFWIAGPPHVVRYLGPDGRVRAEMTRLAGDTLVWQEGDTLWRMESPLGMAETLRLAESVEE